MNRLLTATVLGLLVGSVAWADIPAPKGLKRLPMEHKITTEKEYPDYTFFAVSGGDKATALKLDPKTPATIAAGGGRYRFASLVAVPKDAAKKYDSEKDFLAAVAGGKVDGLLRSKLSFSAFTEVKDSETRKVIVVEYKIEKIDAKEGIVFAGEKKDSGRPVPPGLPPNDSPEDSDGTTDAAVTAYTPRGGLWIAGLAASLALVLTGLWMVRRNR